MLVSRLGFLALGVCVCFAWGAVAKMACGVGVDGMRVILRQSLDALLQRDRSFAESFVKDRRRLERIVKISRQESRSSRLERSASLHCIVLAFRLARVDDFAAEMTLPVLIAGSLSGVVQYPPVSPYEGDVRQQKVAEGQPQSAGDNHEGSFGQQKMKSARWPSTPLSSAQELAAHANVNPLVR